MCKIFVYKIFIYKILIQKERGDYVTDELDNTSKNSLSITADTADIVVQ